jgi:hypothetical protein
MVVSANTFFDGSRQLPSPPKTGASISIKQLQRTVTRRRGVVASAPFHYALAPRFTRQRAAAELRRKDFPRTATVT